MIDAPSASQYANPKHFNAYAGGSSSSRPAASAGGHGAGPANVSTPPAKAAAASADARRNLNRGGGGPPPLPSSGRMVELAQKLSQYARGGDRRQVLRTLSDPSLMPRMHVLGTALVDDIAAAEREAAGERASLNGVGFLQVKDPQRGGGVNGGGEGRQQMQMPVDSYFLQTLREICGHMCDMDGVDADPMALYGGLLLRLSRSVSERDALEVVTRWSCGRGELVVLPLKRRHHDGLSRCPPPVELELYVEGGNVHAKVMMRHELGMYLRTNLESHGLKRELTPWNALVLAQSDDGAGTSLQSAYTTKLSKIQAEALASPKYNSGLKPWVFVDADVVERINFGTGSSVRMLHIGVPEDKNSGYIKKW